MVDLFLAVVALPLAGWLVLQGGDWWFVGSCSRDLAASGRRSLGEWRGRIDAARARLADMQAPGWYDRQWPICGDLQTSADGEYCTNCYRPPWRHGKVRHGKI